MSEDREERGLEDEIRVLFSDLDQTPEGVWFRKQWDNHPARLVVVLLLFGAFIFRTFEWIIIVYFEVVPVPSYCATELIGVAITVLLIDALNTKRRNKERKAQLIRHMGSRYPDVAVTAAREMYYHGWGFGKDDSLVGTSLKGANLEDAFLGEVNFQGAILTDANLEGACLDGANLQEAFLSWSNLQSANLQNANLEEAWLTGTNLEGASLFGTNLWKADLYKANLEGAMGISPQQLMETRFLMDATMPDGSSPKEWALRLFEEGQIDEGTFNSIVKRAGTSTDEEE